MPFYFTKLEVNFNRLLEKCEDMISHREPCDWRLEQYVKTLNEMLINLSKVNTCQPSKDALIEYSKRVEFIRGFVEAEKLPSVSEKTMANQLLISGSPSSISNKIHQQTKAYYIQELRHELLGMTEEVKQNSNSVRSRKNASVGVPPDDFDAVLRYHNSMQEKVAEEMMSLVQNLKQNSVLAGHIIRKDTENLERTSLMADQRYNQLKVESERLEVHSLQSCNWCVWVMLAIVCVIFMWMIVFMRMFPKQ